MTGSASCVWGWMMCTQTRSFYGEQMSILRVAGHSWPFTVASLQKILSLTSHSYIMSSGPYHPRISAASRSLEQLWSTFFHIHLVSTLLSHSITFLEHGLVTMLGSRSQALLESLIFGLYVRSVCVLLFPILYSWPDPRWGHSRIRSLEDPETCFIYKLIGNWILGGTARRISWDTFSTSHPINI